MNEKFISAWLKFDETARSNLGYNKLQYQEVCECLKAMKPVIQDNGCVPLDIANIFVDLYSAIESSSHRHKGKIAEDLRYAADELAYIAKDITFTEEE